MNTIKLSTGEEVKVRVAVGKASGQITRIQAKYFANAINGETGDNETEMMIKVFAQLSEKDIDDLFDSLTKVFESCIVENKEAVIKDGEIIVDFADTINLFTACQVTQDLPEKKD